MDTPAPTRNLNADLTQAVGRGMACQWYPGYLPSDGYLAFERILDLAISDALEAGGFDQLVTVEQVGEERRVELLGPDSPGEFSYTFKPVKRDGTPESIDAMRQEMIRMERWIRERGAAWREASGLR